MENLENLYKCRINARNSEEQEKYEKELKIKDEQVELCQKFLNQISFLNKYGFNWRIYASCNNGLDCCMRKYEWDVFLLNNTIATSPFEAQIIVKEVDGEIKGKFKPTMLGHGRHVSGEDKDGWFTPKQFVMAFS